jgi:hypothetical protein
LGSFALTALPDDQSVAVLNGTTVTGLARAAADTPVANGFREGAVTNDTTQPAPSPHDDLLRARLRGAGPDSVP